MSSTDRTARPRGGPAGDRWGVPYDARERGVREVPSERRVPHPVPRANDAPAPPGENRPPGNWRPMLSWPPRLKLQSWSLRMLAPPLLDSPSCPYAAIQLSPTNMAIRSGAWLPFEGVIICIPIVPPKSCRQNNRRVRKGETNNIWPTGCAQIWMPHMQNDFIEHSKRDRTEGWN